MPPLCQSSFSVFFCGYNKLLDNHTSFPYHVLQLMTIEKRSISHIQDNKLPTHPYGMYSLHHNLHQISS